MSKQPLAQKVYCPACDTKTAEVIVDVKIEAWSRYSGYYNNGVFYAEDSERLYDTEEEITAPELVCRNCGSEIPTPNGVKVEWG